MINKPEYSLPRRNFLRGQFLNSLKTEDVKKQGYAVIRPPWANPDKFLDKCTACGNCITHCEAQILVRDQDGYPYVDFSQGKQECLFCKACVTSCKVNLFRSTDEIAWQHKVEIQTNCLANKLIECRSCEDSCEQRAIRFKREIGKVAKPLLNLELCNGCGACLSSCPTQAITILYL
ncbi:ferredoxin-type protein NapF [Otariodibacter sp.]|uniref:ferredoxin-type protein NapF n=1 Tax=Otariodibacter sp. TaxID=3030919 RepID=UPI00261191B1|nr:ferredoxin-type protein NapF [Otariodibacter sp.]